MLVSNDAAGDGILEGATFCKVNDDKRPGLVPSNPDGPTQVCPVDLSMAAEEVTDGVPLSWYVRIQFDELLDPDIEDLLPIPGSDLMRGSLERTQPVILTCRAPNSTSDVDVPYDGYYNPSGNSQTWPLGPGLYIAPNDNAYETIPTGSSCTVTIKADVVVDKDGQRVPDDQLGPYTFKLAELDLLSSDPDEPDDPKDPDTTAPEDALVLTFNAHIKVTSLLPRTVKIEEVTACTDMRGLEKPVVVREHKDDDEVDKTSIEIVDGSAAPAAFLPEKTYLVTFDGSNVEQDGIAAGGGHVSLDEHRICFKTDKLSP